MAYTFKHGDRPLEGYVIQRAVGQGGFGEVYYAISDGGREVALKYLRNNPEIELRGVTHCMNLKSPHLVNIFDVRKGVDGEYFIVMEYVSGPSLRDLMVSEPRGLGVQKAAYFVREIAKGLAYLHDRGIVHRDLKPGNIFYEDGYVKIGDYGLSKFISVSRHSAQTASVGTVHYMAPEVGSGNYSRGIDIYALGVMLYEMLLGRVPFEGATLGEVLMKHLMAQPAVDELPPPFPEVIRKALAKDPKDRYQTVDEMVAEIFGVEDVQNSLAGFNPTSLSSAVRRVGAPDPSPMPSPNPPGQGYRAQPAIPIIPGAGVPVQGAHIPRRLADRIDSVSDKVHRKMEQLAGAPLPRKQPLRSPAVSNYAGRMQDSLLISGGILVAVAVLVGLSTGEAGMTVSSAALVAALAAGAVAAFRWSVRAPGRPHAVWVNRIMHACISAPLMFVAVIPAVADGRGDDEKMVIAGTLLLCALFLDWHERFQTGARGVLSWGKAFSWALGVFILTAIFTEGEAEFMWSGAAIAAGASLVTQVFGWLALAPSGERVRSRDLAETIATPVPARPEAPSDSPAYRPQATPVIPAARGITDIGGAGRGPAGTEPPAETIPYGVPIEAQRAFARRATVQPPPPARPMWQRVVASFFAFCLFGGMVATFIVNLVERSLSPAERAGLAIGTAACFCCLCLALSKTTVRRRPTFYREHLKPFLLTLTMTGMLGFGSGAIILENYSKPNPPRRQSYSYRYRGMKETFIVLSGTSALLSGVVLLTGRRRRSADLDDPILTMEDFVRGAASPQSPATPVAREAQEPAKTA